MDSCGEPKVALLCRRLVKDCLELGVLYINVNLKTSQAVLKGLPTQLGKKKDRNGLLRVISFRVPSR